MKLTTIGPVWDDGQEQLVRQSRAIGSSHGFVPIERGVYSRTQSSLGFVDGTRTFTLTPIGTMVYGSDGAAYSVTAPASIQWANAEGMHWFYFVGATLTVAANPSTTDLLDILARYCPIAALYWDATNLASLPMDERHSQGLPSATHRIMHRGMGARLARLDASYANITAAVNGNGNDNASASISVAGSTLLDEDIDHAYVGPQTSLRVAYLSGSAASPAFRMLSATPYPLAYGGHGLTAGSRAGYNLLSGGTWSLAEVSSSNFVLAHVLRTNISTDPYIALVGQAQYTTLANARTGLYAERNDLAHGLIPFPEFKFVGTLIAETSNAYSNAPKARWRSTDLGEAFIDLRALPD